MRRHSVPLCVLPLLLALNAHAGPLSGPLATAATTRAELDAGDDAYRYLAGLCERDLHDLAVEEGRAFLRDHRGHPKEDLARYRLADALFELGRVSEAAEHLRRLSALQGFEFETEVWFRLGQCELAEGRDAEAERALGRVIGGARPYLAEHARFLLAECAFRRGDWRGAEERYRELERRHPGGTYTAEAEAALVWCAWRRDELETAATRAARYLERHGAPREAAARERADELRLVLGEALARLDRPEDALRVFAQVPAADATDEPGREREEAALRGAAFALADLGRHAEAARAFGALLERFPRGRFASEAMLHRGIHQLEAGDAAEAVRTLGARRERDPQGLEWLARAQLAAGEPEAALASVELALGARPRVDDAARLQVLRGDLLGRLGRADEAVGAYEHASTEEGLHAGAVAALAAGDRAGAIRLARGFLERYPDSPLRARTELALGEALFGEERWEEAAASFRSVLEREPEDLHAGSRLAWCDWQRGEPAAAADRFGRLAARRGEEPELEEAAMMAGRALEELGDTDGARRAWIRYLERHPAGMHRAEVLLGLARVEPGRAGTARLEQLIALDPDAPAAADASLALAEALSAAGDLDGAAARYEAFLARAEEAAASGAPDGRAAAARYGLAWCRAQSGRHAEAATLLESVAGDRAADPALRVSALELLVWTRSEAGEGVAARDAWLALARACDDERRLFQAARNAARALGAEGRGADARRLLDQLAGHVRDPELAADVLVEGAWLALDEGDVKRAEAQVRSAAQRSPDSPAVAEAGFHVAEACFAAGDDARAIELYGGAAAARGSEVADRALYKRGFAQLRSGQERAALASFEAVVEGFRDSELWAESLFLAGEAAFRLGDRDGAIARLERLRREAPRHEVLPKALFRLGVALGEQGRWSEAEAALTALLRAQPDFANRSEAELWRGLALAALGEERPARMAFERVVADERSVLAARARLGLGRLELDAGRSEEALSQFLKVAVLFPEEPEVPEALYLAGLALERLGDTARAREQYREVLDEHGASAWAARARERQDELNRP